MDLFNDEELEVHRILSSIPQPNPPDGGWGWFIVLSSFLMNVIVDGVCYSYGIMLPELVQEFGMSLPLMSLGGALLLGTYMMTGGYIWVIGTVISAALVVELTFCRDITSCSIISHWN